MSRRGHAVVPGLSFGTVRKWGVYVRETTAKRSQSSIAVCGSAMPARTRLACVCTGIDTRIPPIAANERLLLPLYDPCHREDTATKVTNISSFNIRHDSVIDSHRGHAAVRACCDLTDCNDQLPFVSRNKLTCELNSALRW